MRVPPDAARRGAPISRVFGIAESTTVARIARLDIVTWVLVLHGASLVAAGRVLDPRWVGGLVAAFGVWRFGFQVVLNRADDERVAGLVLIKVVGSLLLASAVIAADGGTESPFFFWPLLLLAFNALVTSAAHLLVMSGVAVAGYVGVMLAVPDVTAASIGRLALLVSFCAVLELGRLRIDHHRREAERADEDRRRFLMMASHQLKTPLTPIVAYAELLRSGAIAVEDVQIAAGEILDASREMERLFDRMAAVVRLQGEVAAEKVTVPVAAVLDELRAEHPRLLDDVVVSGDAAVAVRCRPGGVESALYELLDNGRRFGRPPVRLDWDSENGHVALVVSDAGEGPEPHLTDAELFGHWGTGTMDDVMPVGVRSRLGLFQARLLAELSGGSLKLRRGSAGWAFVLRLPAGSAPTHP